MYFKGARCCAEGIFQCETRSSYHHISHDVFVKGKLVRSTCLGCNWFYGKVFMDVYVFTIVCFHDSKPLAGNQATWALPLTPPLNPPPCSGLGSISNFLELISLQQEGGHCLICPKDIIKH